MHGKSVVSTFVRHFDLCFTGAAASAVDTKLFPRDWATRAEDDVAGHGTELEELNFHSIQDGVSELGTPARVTKKSEFMEFVSLRRLCIGVGFNVMFEQMVGE